MPRRPRVRLKVDGPDVKPGSIGLLELAQDLKDLDAALRAAGGGGEGDIVASLVAVRDGCVEYDLELPTKRAVQAYGKLSRGAKKDGVDLGEARAPLAAIADRNRRLKRTFTLKANKTARAPNVDLTDHFRKPITPPPPVIGDTTIYGRVVGALLTKDGGNVFIVSTIDGAQVRCRGDKQTIRKLGRRLDEEVGLEGSATWDPDTLELREFRIVEVLSYEAKPVDEIRSAAREAKVFDDVSADDFIEIFRGDDG
jgi:hypothetical protein